MTNRIMGKATDRCVHGIPLDKPCMGCESVQTIKASQPPIAVPPDLTPLIPDTVAAVTEQAMPSSIEELILEPSPGVVAAQMVEEEAKAAEEAAQSIAKVDLQFPAIGFIDPVTELEKMRRLADLMPEAVRFSYPEQIRAKLLAHHAKPTENPEVADEELALAIFIKRMQDSPLTAEDVETKTTGRRPKGEAAPKATKAKKEKAAPKGIDDILGGL